MKLLTALALMLVAVTSMAEAQQRPQRPPAAAGPEAQARFLAVIAEAREQFLAAENDMARGALRPRRARSICQVITGPRVQGWVGTIERLGSTSQGDGVLDVRIDRRVVLRTRNNRFSDQSEGTLIGADSALFQRVVGLRRGQRVEFDGQFFRGDDCVREGSLTVAGSMTEPDFVFRFTDVRPVP